MRGPARHMLRPAIALQPLAAQRSLRRVTRYARPQRCLVRSGRRPHRSRCPDAQRRDASSTILRDTPAEVRRRKNRSLPSGYGRLRLLRRGSRGDHRSRRRCRGLFGGGGPGHRRGDAAQPASTAVPAIIATPTARPKRDVLSIIVWLPGIRAGGHADSDRTTRDHPISKFGSRALELLGGQMTAG